MTGAGSGATARSSVLLGCPPRHNRSIAGFGPAERECRWNKPFMPVTSHKGVEEAQQSTRLFGTVKHMRARSLGTVVKSTESTNLTDASALATLKKVPTSTASNLHASSDPADNVATPGAQ